MARAVGRVVAALLLGLSVLAVSAVVASSPPVLAFTGRHPWVPVLQAVMVAASLIWMLILGRGGLTAYGFRGVHPKRLLAPALVGSAAGIVMALAVRVTPAADLDVAADLTLFQVIAVIWISASIAEEVLTRGLVQGFLEPLKGYGLRVFRLRLSIPVIVGAVFFGLMHLALLSTGAAAAAVVTIALFAVVLGLVAGYYRESTGSLWPAILVHFLFNLWGSAVDWLAGALNA
jgi:membrane protease YdiL (CAAX protease family)